MSTKRTKVGPEVFQARYDIGLQVLSGTISSSDAREELVSITGRPGRTADAYWRCCVALHRGLQIRDTISASGWRYNLERLANEGGLAALVGALEVLMEHIAYLTKGNPNREPSLRMVHKEFTEKLQIAAEVAPLDEEIADQIIRSMQDPSEARKRRLASAEKKPPQMIVITRYFQRNPDVIAEVLLRANGVCEGCGNHAPFKRVDGRPYLEVHHKQSLADGGDDTVENAAALCPNCHRERHFGINYRGDLSSNKRRHG